MTKRQPLPDPSRPDEAFATVVSLRRTAAQLELAAVREAIAQGWTWADVGDALGISAQGAHKKFASLIRTTSRRS